MQTKKPTLIIVHGAWHRPSHFELLISGLESYGYKVLAPALPSVDRIPHHVCPDSTEDIAAVRAAILPEIEGGNQVILVPHSYGGIPASGAVEGLDRQTRQRDGKSGGVIAIAALTSFVLPKGQGIFSATGSQKPDTPKVMSPLPIEHYWHDVPESSELYKESEAKLGLMSSFALWDQCRFSAYKVVDVHYLICAEDRAILRDVQARMVETIRNDGGKVRIEVLKGCSHSPFLSRVDETVAFLRRSAGEMVS
jgi:pimeloyl-ACP methyl ester carboxylesterase